MKINKRLIIVGLTVVALAAFAYLFWQYNQYKEPVLVAPIPQSAAPVEIKPITENLPQLKPKPNDHFFARYLKLHQKILQGKDYSEEIANLNSNSEQINNLLAKLAALAEENTEDSYFLPAFSKMIPQLYGYNKVIAKYIFIRPTGDRAIKKGGLDSIIEKIMQALEKKDLANAEINIEELSAKQDILKEFQRKLQIRIRLKNYLEQIDQLIGEM